VLSLIDASALTRTSSFDRLVEQLDHTHPSNFTLYYSYTIGLYPAIIIILIYIIIIIIIYIIVIFTILLKLLLLLLLLL
jgi:hypothetical protein